MFTFGFLVRIILISIVYRSIVEIQMFNKKQAQKKKYIAYKKDIIEYNQYLDEYETEKYKYDTLCNDYNISSILMDDAPCKITYYDDDYAYKGLWENYSQNGFGVYMHGDVVLISGSRKNNKYNGMVKIHVEESPENAIYNYNCVYEEGARKKCYVDYKDGSTYSITNEKLNELKLFDFV